MNRPKLRSIPPLTSTGGGLRRRTPVIHSGLLHFSIGGFTTGKPTQSAPEEDIASWDPGKFARSEFNRKPKKKGPSATVHDSFKNMSCTVELAQHNNEEGDFTISLCFNGIDFLSESVTAFSAGISQRSYQIPVRCRIPGKTYLLLTTSGDIFEYEVVRDINDCCSGECFRGKVWKGISGNKEKKYCPNRLFMGEKYLQGFLQAYDPLSMRAIVSDKNCISISYNKI